MSDNFDKLRDTFNIEEKVKEAEVFTMETKKKITEVKTNLNQKKYNLEQLEYVRVELQDILATSKRVMDKLAEECECAASLKVYDSFANVQSKVIANVKELFQVEKDVVDYQIKEDAMRLKEIAIEEKSKLAQAKLQAKSKLPDGSTITQNNIILTKSSDLLDKLLEAQKNSKVNTTELPTFELE